MASFNFDEPVPRRGFGGVKWDSAPEDALPMFAVDMDFRSAPQITEALAGLPAHGVFGYGRDEGYARINFGDQRANLAEAVRRMRQSAAKLLKENRFH